MHLIDYRFVIRLTIMKALVLSLLLGLACHAASEVYTWDFSTNGPYLDGEKSTHNKCNISIIDVEINGVSSKAFGRSTRYCEQNTQVLYDMLECASMGKALQFSMDIYWSGGTQTQSNTWQTILHIGSDGNGITLGMNQSGQLFFASLQNDYDYDVKNGYPSYEKGLIEAAQLTANSWNAVSFTLSGDKTFITVGELTYQGNDLTWEDMRWDSGSGESLYHYYTLGCRARGKWDADILEDGVTIANLKVELIPEPATVSLSLLAITCLITRRRRD